MANPAGAVSIVQTDLTSLSAEMRRGIHIGDRKYHGRMFKACFLGKDAVDWLVKNGHADSRKKAMMMGQALFVMKLLQHVTDDHSFKVPNKM